jgi:hypothetical protein
MLELLGILSEPRFEHSGRDDRSRVRQDYRTGYYGKDDVAEIRIGRAFAARLALIESGMRATEHSLIDPVVSCERCHCIRPNPCPPPHDLPAGSRLSPLKQCDA